MPTPIASGVRLLASVLAERLPASRTSLSERARFARASALREALAEGRALLVPAGRVPTAGEALAGLALLRRAERALVRPLASHDEVRRQGIADEVKGGLREVRLARRRLSRALLQAARPGRAHEAAPAVLGYLDALERLALGLLCLAHRPRIDDAFHGLDPRAPYPSFRRSALNRGFVPAPAAPATGERVRALREVPQGGMIWPSFIVDREGRLYGGHARSEHVALDANGRRRFAITDPQMLYVDSTGALGRDGFLYLASTDAHPNGHQNQGRIWKVDPESGEVVWTFWGRHFDDPETDAHAQLASFFEGHVALGLDGERVVVYAGSDDCHLYKLDDAGTLVWDYRAGEGPSHHIWTKPCLSPRGDAVFIGTLGGEVHAIDAAAGRRLWMRRLGGGVVSSIAVGLGGELVLGCFDGNVYCLHPESGATAWTYPTLGLIYASPAIDAESGDIVIGSGDGTVLRLDRFGRRRWSYRTSGPIKSSPLLDGRGRVTIGNEAGTLYQLDAEGRRVFSLATSVERSNDINASPSMARDGTVIVGSTDGRLFLIGPRYHEVAADADPRLSLDPGPDGPPPVVAPGEAGLVLLDRRGRIEAPGRPATRLPGEPLALDLVCVDERGEPAIARLDPTSLEASFDPPLRASLSVSGSGRTLHVIPEDLPAPGSALTLSLSAAYERGATRGRIEARVDLAIEGAEGSIPAPDAGGCPTFVVGDWALIRPKEVDALAQAGMEAVTYQMAIVHVDEARGRFVAVGSGAVRGPDGRWAYAPRSANRFVGQARTAGRAFRLEGPVTTIAQGNRCHFERTVMVARFDERGALHEGAGVSVLPAEGAIGFTDVLRAMRLPDADDRIVASGAFRAEPATPRAASRPEGPLDAEVSRRGRRIEARLRGDAARPDERWLHALALDAATGDLIHPGACDLSAEASDEGATIALVVPASHATRDLLVLVLVDLFPVERALVPATAEALAGAR